MNMNVKDLLDCRTQDELLRFLHCKKTTISCLDQPHILLHQLRDHNLVPKHLYEKVKKMKSKEKRKDGMYEILDWIEKTKASSVHMFWFCVFEDHVLQQYPALRLLRKSLMDESFRFCENLPDPEDQPEREQNPGQSKEATAKEKKRGKKRKKSADEAEAEEDEQPGPSSSAHKKKKLPKKPVFSTPVKKGQRQDIWTWPIYQTTLPITCGDKQATLHRNKLATGEKCIQFKGRWFTPPEFEKFAGRGKWKNWKVSIRCQKTPLQKLIEGGHLQPLRRKRRCVKKSKRVLFPPSPSESPSSHSDSSEESESSRDDLHERSNEREQEDREGQVTEDNEEEEEETEPVDPSVFQASTLPVRCGSVKGVLHKYRFVSGSRGKSIRTEERWLTPEDFVKEESTLMEGHWKKDIHCYGKMLNFLLQKKILVVHSLLCKCDLCDPEQQNQEQDNDDMCFICNTEGELVCCDNCPRAFHGQCHLPALQEDTLGEQWMCTYCVLHTNRLWWDTDHMSQEDAMNRPISQYTLLCEYLLLCLYKEDVQRVFTEDPTATVSDYTRVISEPMWLNKVRTKLRNKQYSRLSQFVSDIRLIISNCHVFNRDNTEFDRMGSRLSDVFERELRTIFSIQ